MTHLLNSSGEPAGSRPAAGVSRRSVLGGVALGGLLLAGSKPGALATPAAPAAVPPRRDLKLIRLSGAQFNRGRGEGVAIGKHGIALSRPNTRRSYTDVVSGTAQEWEYGTWTSPTLRNGFDLTELIASWNAQTPGRTWVELQVRGKTPSGTVTGWYIMARWCRFDPEQGGGIHRTTVKNQGTDIATVYTDTLATRDGQSLREVQLRVLLMRPVGSKESPVVSSVAAISSALPEQETVPVSTPGNVRGRVLNVPTYSQELHVGHYPQWDNGGEAWCSPTSTAMVADYWKSGPTPKDYAWVEPGPDRQVDYAARNTFDYTYDGCGNWPFNTAYAAGLGLTGFVTRLRSLREAESFIAAGIPLVLSVSFKAENMDGAGYSTNGHLLVLRGFDAAGNPVINDPASHLKADNGQVRVTYRRDQLENAWVPHSGGTTYVITPRGTKLPPAPPQGNW